MRILVIHGPNLNMLGKRDSKHYGHLTLDQINKLLTKKAVERGVKLVFFQSNCEGDLIDFIQKQCKEVKGILINPAALTHYGYSLRDALEDTKIPIVEVHLSDISNREAFRKKDLFAPLALGIIMNQKEKSYLIGLERLINFLQK